MNDIKVILLEFNELCPSLMDQFIADGSLPHFELLRAQSHVFITDAKEDPPNLEPWIQWVTVHTGVGFEEHGVFHLGEGAQIVHKCIWDLLAAAKLKVGICGSMNVRYDPTIEGYFVPDPWTLDARPHPQLLGSYIRFVQANVQEHTKNSIPFKLVDYIRFLSFMLAHGLSRRTVGRILKQLASEIGGRNRWKRVFLLDRLQLDLFRDLYRHTVPDFSTFFLNSTAHIQHMHWRNHQPEVFPIKPSPREQHEFASSIHQAYQEMDGVLGEILSLVRDDAYVLFCTALSQQPCLKYEDFGGKRNYRPRNFKTFLKALGIMTRAESAPVMAEEFYLRFETEAAAAVADALLKSLKCGEQNVMSTQLKGSTLFAGCSIHDFVPEHACVSVLTNGRSVPFFELFYLIDGVKSGMHHPDGMLWIRSPEKTHKVHTQKVTLTTIAPTILDLFGVEAPPEMRGELLLDLRRSAPAIGVGSS